MAKKNYVLDTNILLSSPEAIYGFDDNNVFLTATTLQELDTKKIAPGELGYNAREAIRILDGLRDTGNLYDGVLLSNEGTFRVISECKDSLLPDGFDITRPDNRIIATILTESRHNTDEKFILVTNDISMRVNANICRVEVQSYHNERVKTDEEYTGRRDILVEKRLIDDLFATGILKVKDFYDLKDVEFIENEFVVLKDKNYDPNIYVDFNYKSEALAIYKTGELKLIHEKSALSVKPKNNAQKFALYALLAPVDEIPVVVFKGPAGCAKTFLSLAAGMEQVKYTGISGEKTSGFYDKVLITRNNVTSDSDFGYLPGDIDEKMGPLMAPFYDNLESLLRGGKDDDVQAEIEDLFDTGTIAVCPLAYMRGRSITHSFLIVDEAQNSTRSQMRDIITRAGKGTKIIICGDPAQIDNHTLDKYNNGLVFLANRMKGSPLCAQITFNEEESVRSDLAKEALKRLNL